MHTFEYVGLHAEDGDIVGTVRSFWYHLVVLRLMGYEMYRGAGEIYGQR